MKRLISPILFGAMVLFVTNSCEKETENIPEQTFLNDATRGSDWIFDIAEDGKLIEASLNTSTYHIIYYGDNSKPSIFNSGIEVFNAEGTELIFNTSFEENLAQEFYKLHTRNDLKEIADEKLVSTALSYDDFSALSTHLKYMHEQIKIYSGDAFFENLMYNGINFHWSIVDMLKRAKTESSEECDCNSTALYFEENAAFACTQDIVFKKEVVVNFLTANEYDPELIDIMSGFPKLTISLEELEAQYSSLPSSGDIVMDPISHGRIFCFGLSGSDVGCCGNYSGPCWYCHVVCAVHDLLCWCCDSSIVPCFSGCVSEEGC